MEARRKVGVQARHTKKKNSLKKQKKRPVKKAHTGKIICRLKISRSRFLYFIRACEIRAIESNFFFFKEGSAFSRESFFLLEVLLSFRLGCTFRWPRTACLVKVRPSSIDQRKQFNFSILWQK